MIDMDRRTFMEGAGVGIAYAATASGAGGERSGSGNSEPPMLLVPRGSSVLLRLGAGYGFEIYGSVYKEKKT